MCAFTYMHVKLIVLLPSRSEYFSGDCNVAGAAYQTARVSHDYALAGTGVVVMLGQVIPRP